jgi:hypothetical protein
MCPGFGATPGVKAKTLIPMSRKTENTIKV